jgi:hypothetical protein
MLIRLVVIFCKWKRKSAWYLRNLLTTEARIWRQRYLKSFLTKVSPLPIAAVGSVPSWLGMGIGSMNSVKGLVVLPINGGGYHA